MPLAIDLCSGLGGWAEGLEAEGWTVIRVDIEDMFLATGTPKPDPCLLMLQDICTVHGSQLKHADLIVGSSPCQDFSYRAMPWKRAKALHAPFLGIYLFWQQFRIQREASEAAGRHIPMVVENVRGAIPWVGRSKWNFGSFHLWGDVPALMPSPRSARVAVDKTIHKGDGGTLSHIHVGEGVKGAHGTSGSHWTNPNERDIRIDGRKVPGFRFDGSGRSFQTASVNEGLKHGGDWFSDPSSPSRQGGQVKGKVVAEGRKGAGAGAGAEWFDGNLCVKSSNSPARKLASAKIAKIPEAVSRHIARVYHP